MTETPMSEFEIGGGVWITLDADGGGLLWKHPECRSWFTLRFAPEGTGHRLVGFEPLTIDGSLLCPKGCGKHGFIREGKWVEA